MAWLDSIRNAVSPSAEPINAPDEGYEVIRGEEGDELVHSTEALRPIPTTSKGVHVAFWTLGAGILLSWSALICSFPLMSLFFQEGSTRTNLASYLGTLYCFGNFVCLGLARNNHSATSLNNRQWFSLSLLMTACVFALPAICFIPFNFNDPFVPAFQLFIITVSLSVATGILQSTVFALASLWGSNSVLAVMSGQGGVAVLVSGFQLVVSILAAFGPGSRDEGSVGDPSRSATVGVWLLVFAGTLGCMVAHRYLFRHPDCHLVLAPLLAREDGTETQAKGFFGDQTSRSVFQKNIRLEVAVALVFIITLAVFPPVTSTITSVRSPPPMLLQASVFIPLHFFIFNVGDYIGRTYLPVIPRLMITDPSKILWLSMSRVVYLALFAWCNVSPGNGRAPLINSDMAFFAILLSCGLTNGWISSLSMIVASSPALNPRITDAEKDVAGNLAAFSLVGGLLGGSLLSFVVNWAIRGDPFSSG